MKTTIRRKFSFQKRTQFSHGNNALGVTVNNIGLFVWRETFVSSTKLNCPFWSNRAYLTLETPSCRKYFFNKLIHFSQEENELHFLISP
jgi:hypothetical protein